METYELEKLPSYTEQEKMAFPKIQKNFFMLHDDVKNRSQADVDLYLKENEITSEGQDIPRPVQTFKESSFPKYLVDQLEGQFKVPSTIQSQSWPVVLQGRDLIGVARTGSGKTLSFIMPAIVHVMSQDVLHKGDGPIVLVLAPTRELANQIQQETKKFASACQLSSLCVYGGAPKYEQKSHLYRGVEILIATPGRLLDFLNNGDTNLKRCTYLVLDEADRMLDMGFEKDIRKIIAKIPHPERQTLMFSATWPKDVQQIARDYCYHEPCTVRIGRDENLAGGLTVNKDISQEICVLGGNYEKYERVVKLIQDNARDSAQKIIIFCQTKKGVDELERNLRGDRQISGMGIKVEARGIHGDKQQFERDRIFNAFKKPTKENFDIGINGEKTTKTNILIATDVASRGLDVRDITMVINYDLPTNIEDYVHRIGRTGRAGDKGRSFSLLNSCELGLVADLVKVMKSSGQPVSDELMQLKNEASQNHFDKKQRYRNGGGGNRQSSRSVAYPQKFQRTNNYDQPVRQSTSYTSYGGAINDRQVNSTPMDNYNNSSGASKKRDEKYDNKQSDRYNQKDLKNDLWGNGQSNGQSNSNNNSGW